MASETNLAHLSSRIDSLLQKYRREAPVPKFPIDLDLIAKLCGVKDIRLIEMIPEGVLDVGAEGFLIFLQSNFSNFPSAGIRQRFTLAHEICHTMFFDHDGSKKPRRRRINEEELESLCNRGAGWLLLPSAWMTARARRDGKIRSAASLLDLSKDAEVSLEVVFRRLHEEAATWIESDNSFVLVRNERGQPTVRGISFGPWLAGQFPEPKLWELEAQWLGRARLGLETGANGSKCFYGPLGPVALDVHALTPFDRIYHLRLEKRMLDESVDLGPI